MIELTGQKTNTKYFINPNVISSFQELEGYAGTIIYTIKTSKGPCGDGTVYNVTETPEEILNMILLREECIRV